MDMLFLFKYDGMRCQIKDFNLKLQLSQPSTGLIPIGYPFIAFSDSHGASDCVHLSVVSLPDHDCENPGEWLTVKISASSYRAPIPAGPYVPPYCNPGLVKKKQSQRQQEKQKK